MQRYDEKFRSRGQVIDLIQNPRGPAPEMKYAMLGVQILKRHPIKGASLSLEAHAGRSFIIVMFKN